MKTHRCTESLKQKIPIRNTNPYSLNNVDSVSEKWYLYRYYDDWDTLSKGIAVVCEIKVCPFCAEILK